MANKYKDIKIVDAELQPTAIGAIKSKKSGLLPLFFIFSMLIGFTIGLPYITEYLETKEESNYPNSNTGSANDDENGDLTNPDNEETPDKEYLYIEGMDISTTNFNLENINFEDGILNIIIKNNLNYEIKVDAYNYYLDVYDSDNKLTRFSFDGVVVEANRSIDLSFELDVAYINYFKLPVITEDDYPQVNINYDEYGIGILKCSKNESVISYTFDSEGLTSFKDEIVYSSANDDFQEKLSNYIAFSSDYNKYEGIDSFVNSNVSAFAFVLDVDLSIYDNTTFDNPLYSYPKNSKLNTIGFKVETHGYSCS